MPKSFLLSLNCNNKSILYSIQQQSARSYFKNLLNIKGLVCTFVLVLVVLVLVLDDSVWDFPWHCDLIQENQFRLNKTKEEGRPTYVVAHDSYFTKEIWNKNIFLKCRFNTDLYEPAFLYIFLHNYIETVKKSYLK